MLHTPARRNIPGRRTPALAGVLLALGLAAGACGRAEAAPSVEDAWAATTVGSDDPTETGVYLVVENTGEEDVVLQGASSPVAGSAVLHETTGEESVEVDGITVTAGRGKVLEPGGFHVMLLDLTEELEVGEEIEVTLEFSDGTDETLTVPVKEGDGHDHTHAPEPTPAAESTDRTTDGATPGSQRPTKGQPSGTPTEHSHEGHGHSH